MFIYTKNEIQLEGKLHRFANRKYARVGRLEIFLVPERKQLKLIKSVIKKYSDWKDVQMAPSKRLKC